MPECTEAERALLDLVLRGESNGKAIETAVSKVQAERLSPELRERAIAVHAAWLEADKQKGDLWNDLAKLGLIGAKAQGLFGEIEGEARKRLNGGNRG